MEVPNSKLSVEKNGGNESLYAAFCLVEEICRNINYLRETIEAEIKKIPPNTDFEVRDYSPEKFHPSTSSEWLTREIIDTFKIVNYRGKALRFHCAIQITLSPDPRCDLESFTPHVAMLAAKKDDWDSWEEGEFILTDSFLESDPDPNNGFYGWERKSNTMWVGPRNETPYTYLSFIVPLNELNNESDVQEKLVGRLLLELRNM